MKFLVHRSVLKYEFHWIPKYTYTDFGWWASRELRWFKYRVELKIFDAA